MPNTMNNCLGQLVGQPNSGVSLRKWGVHEENPVSNISMGLLNLTLMRTALLLMPPEA